MSKYIIDIPKTVGMLEAVGSVHYTYFDGIQVQTIVLKGDEIEELNADYINKHFSDLQDTAYQRGLHEGNDIGYKDGFEDGKAVNDRGCEGCEYAGKVRTGPPCISCCNSYRNQWTAKSDKIEVGDEDSIIAGDEVKAEDGTVVFFVTWMSDRCICGVDKEGKCYSYEPKEICGKTGRHFDIILEEKKA